VPEAERLLEPLLSLHDRVRSAVLEACTRQATEHLAAVAADGDQHGDTIYAIDRVAEETFARGLSDLARAESICVIGEGLSGDGLPNDGRWALLVDPIDGTRGLMYQKRSAWILTGVAPNRGPNTRLRDIVLAVQTEIPLVKQHLSDQLWAIHGRGLAARRGNRLSGAGAPERLTLRPSSADTIAHGFATVVRFFPGAREVLAGIDDEVMEALVPRSPGKAASFEDQYASTAGQLYELLSGHDRFIADLRPLVQPAGLCCHPYDLCTALIASEGGVILTDAGGAPLDAPFDLATNVGWIGYANERLRARIEPVLRDALRRRGLLP
jgi:hypothetical protein